MGTVQVDFQLPLRFNLSYIDSDGEKKTPIMLHRALFGSFERFIGILTEHYAGAFPTWLSPVQVKILPIADAHKEYAEKVLEELDNNGIRAELDERQEKIGYKIREAQLQKIPYMLIIGDKEVEANAVGVRSRSDGDIGAMGLEDFISKIKKEVEEYTVESFKETSVMLTTQNGSMEVQKYKLPLELEIGDILIQNEFGICEKK